MALAQNRRNIHRLCAPHFRRPPHRWTTGKGLPMPKEEWGTKRLCPTTGKRFYDMNRSPIVSPYTGDVVELDSTKTRMIAADAEDAVTAKAKATTAATDEDQVLDDDDVDVDLDDDLLDDDEDEDTVPLEEIADVASEDDDS
mmetsp:Transcript_8583/g.14905  ORF Transcript_8583/g.14905 Transcript_8583/m.14905 type:complete len:142 (+) Transcript_8583:23-448(+)